MADKNGCHKLDFSFRISEMVQDRANVNIYQLQEVSKTFSIDTKISDFEQL